MFSKRPQTRNRLDCLLVERSIFDSREKAQRAILAGLVEVNGVKADKPGAHVPPDHTLAILEKERYVSRGGLKLEAALKHFSISPHGKVCLDVGASTGGFTDCLLQHGAQRVYALDVGHGQLAWQLRTDPRVVVQEKVNARYLTAVEFSEAIELAVIDVSFISLTHILPAVVHILQNGAGSDLQTNASHLDPKVIISLIKPQFELGYHEVSRGQGVIRDEHAKQRAVEKICDFAAASFPKWQSAGTIGSPILGAKGNQEFLMCLLLHV